MNFHSTDLYIFCLCAVVFTAFTVLLTWLIATMVRYYVRLVRLGAEDAGILKEYESEKRERPLLNALGTIINLTICVALIVAFAFSISVTIDEKRDDTAAKTGTLRVVKSNSMAKAYEKNEYLSQNGLTNDKYRFSAFDLIYTDALPKESELKLYDVVVYDLDGYFVIHRIVEIEEPNSLHPDEYYYYLRGDNNVLDDPKPVKYSQMRGVWRGAKVEQVGSFVLFMQSPAGFLCVLLMIFAVIALPLVSRKVDKERAKRYERMAGEAYKTERRIAAEERLRRPALTHYNRPNSPYSAPKQNPYQEPPQAQQALGFNELLNLPQYSQIKFTVDHTPPGNGNSKR